MSSLVMFLTGKKCYWPDVKTIAAFWNGGCRLSHGGDAQFVWSNQCSQQGLTNGAVTELMNYTEWGPGEPNDAGHDAAVFGSGESCMTVFVDPDGSANWNDAACSLALCSVCELERS